MGPRSLKDVDPRVFHEVVIECELGTQSEFAENRPHRPANVFASGLGVLQVDVKAAIVADPAAIEEGLEGKEDRSLASLAWGVQEEVILLTNQIQHVILIYTCQWRYAVLILRYHRARRVEVTHLSMMTAPRRSWQRFRSTTEHGPWNRQRAVDGRLETDDGRRKLQSIHPEIML